MTARCYTPTSAAGLAAGAREVFQSWLTQRELVGALIKRDVLLRYRGSLLGLLWSLVSPLVLLGVYTVVFGVFFKLEWTSSLGRPVPFVIMLFCGQVPYLFFSEVLGKSPALILNSPNYVKRIAFPLQLLPLVATGGALFHTLINFALLLAAVAVWSGGLPVTLWYLPLVLAPFIACTLTLSLLVSALGVFLRDLAHAMGLALNVLFFLTPIVYSETLVTPRWQFLLWINPVAYAVSNLRKICVLGEPINLTSWALFTAVSFTALFLVAGWFPGVRRRFADVL